MANHQDIQSKFLEELRDQKIPTYIFLVSGIKLCGYVAGFDQFAVHLRNGNNSQMIYKHAISTIMYASKETESMK